MQGHVKDRRPKEHKGQQRKARPESHFRQCKRISTKRNSRPAATNSVSALIGTCEATDNDPRNRIMHEAEQREQEAEVISKIFNSAAARNNRRIQHRHLLPMPAAAATARWPAAILATKSMCAWRSLSVRANH